MITLTQKQKVILKHIEGMSKRLVNENEKRHREAFIRQEYELGDICEFDWGEVKLNIGGEGFKKYQMAVFTPAKESYRFAMLFKAQDTPAIGIIRLNLIIIKEIIL